MKREIKIIKMKVLRRDFLKLTGSGLAFGIIGLSSKLHTSQGKKKPNIIFLLSDDHRWDAFSYYNFSVVKTPHLDQLIKDGINYLNVHHASPSCLPSRAAIMSGRYESASRVGFSSPNKFTMSRHEFNNMYPGVLRKNGYYTGYIGKYHFPITEKKQVKEKKKNKNKVVNGIPPGEYSGDIWAELFDVWNGIPGQGNYQNEGYYGTKKGEHCTKVRGDLAIEFLEKAKRSGKPFCLSIGFKAPHGPWFEGKSPDPEFYKLYKDVTIPFPDNMTWKDFLKLPDSVKFGLRSSPYNRNGKVNQVYKSRMKDGGKKVQSLSLSQFDKYKNKEKLSKAELFANSYFREEGCFHETMRIYFSLVSGMDHVVGRIRAELNRLEFEDNTIIIYSSDNGSYLGSRMLTDKIILHEEAARAPLIIYDPRLPEQFQGKSNKALLNTVDFAPTIIDLAGCPLPEIIQGESFKSILNNPNKEVNDAVFCENFFTAMGWGSSEEGKQLKKKYGNFESQSTVTKNFKYIRYYKTNPIIEQLYDINKDPNESNDLADNPEFKAILGNLRNRLEKFNNDNEEHRKKYLSEGK